MDKVNRGKKHICSNCMTKFYDFNKDIAICPKCGIKQLSPKVIKQDIENKLNTSNDEEVNKDNNLEEEVTFDDIDITNDEKDL